jgi:hypothetical protein
MLASSQRIETVAPHLIMTITRADVELGIRESDSARLARDLTDAAEGRASHEHYAARARARLQVRRALKGVR